MEEVNKSLRVIELLKQLMDTVKHNVHSHFREMNVTGPQGMLMGTLAHHGEMKVSDLSEKLGLSNSTVSGIIDRLENQGLVTRTRSKEDRRVVYVSVTSEFIKSSKDRFKEIDKMFEAMMSKATSEELDQILQGLDTLQRVFNSNKE
ncbi:MAG: transcriptional regulator, MarR family [Clostridia bacterium]|jgi:DNA-binding MarR family transcriptional regulator|nr:transcriptional regulator, MarR family [Clostridia bacterium]